MVKLQLLLMDGVLLALIFSTFVLGTLLWKPRLWLQDFPADIQAMLPPKTAGEKRLTAFIGVPFFVILFGGLGWSGIRYGLDHGFLALVLHVYLVWQVVNLVDWLVIDWGGMMLIDPHNPPFDGTAGAAGYRDFGFHFVGFLKGSVMGLAFALIMGGIIYVMA